jgi:hypothetical protein
LGIEAYELPATACCPKLAVGRKMFADIIRGKCCTAAACNAEFVGFLEIE